MHGKTDRENHRNNVGSGEEYLSQGNTIEIQVEKKANIPAIGMKDLSTCMLQYKVAKSMLQWCVWQFSNKANVDHKALNTQHS